MSADECWLVVGAGGVLLAGSGVLLAGSGVLVVGAADVQDGTPGWVGEAGGSAVGKTLFFQLLFGTGS